MVHYGLSITGQVQNIGSSATQTQRGGRNVRKMLGGGLAPGQIGARRKRNDDSSRGTG